MRSILKHQKAFFDGWEDQERVTRNVQLGGLCHDLGHGPLSHMFDNTFLPMVAYLTILYFKHYKTPVQEQHGNMKKDHK